MIVISGFKTVVMSKDGKIKKRSNTTTFDVAYLNKNVYAYTLDSDDFAYFYNSTFSKYTSGFELIGSRKLPLSFESVNLVNLSGISQIKKKAIFYQDDSHVKAIILNTPFIGPYDPDYQFNIIQYRVGDFTEEDVDNATNNNNSGIISNITKNPQTNSVIVIIVFTCIVVVISGIYYFLYKRRSNEK